MSNTLVIDWSVWDRKPVVPWKWDGVSAQVVFQKPPIAVCPLLILRQMAIVGDSEEFGAGNLLFYSSLGSLVRKYTAPALGKNVQFGSVREVGTTVEVTVGYLDDQGRWAEVAGTLNLDDGSIAGPHRGY